MRGFTGRSHTEDSKARIGAAMRKLGHKPPPQGGKPLSKAHRAKLRGAKLGVSKTAEHRARIGEGLRRWNAAAEPWQKRRGFRKFLSDEEARDYALLRHRHHYGEAEALRAIGRTDLVEGMAGKRDD